MKELFFSEPERIDPAVANLIGLHDDPHVAPLPPEHEPVSGELLYGDDFAINRAAIVSCVSLPERTRWQ